MGRRRDPGLPKAAKEYLAVVERMQRRRALSDAASSFFQSLAANRPLQVATGAGVHAVGRGLGALLRGEKPKHALEQVGSFAVDLGAAFGYGAYLANSDGGVSLQYDVPDVESPGGGSLDPVQAAFFLPPLPALADPRLRPPTGPGSAAPAAAPERAPAPESAPERAPASRGHGERVPSSRGGPVPGVEDRDPARVPLPVAAQTSRRGSPGLDRVDRGSLSRRRAPRFGEAPKGRVGTPGAGGVVAPGFTAGEALSAVPLARGAATAGRAATGVLGRASGALGRAEAALARAVGRLG